MTATEAEDLAKSEGLVLVPSNSGPHHPRYLGVSMHTDPATNEVFFCASVIQQGTTLYLQDALGNVKFTSDAEAALTFARYTAGRNTVDERSQVEAGAQAQAQAQAGAQAHEQALLAQQQAAQQAAQGQQPEGGGEGAEGENGGAPAYQHMTQIGRAHV